MPRLPRSVVVLLGWLLSATATIVAVTGDCAANSGTSKTAPTFVGAAACGSCHQSEMAAWRGSHHDLAMAEATEKTVLGNFDNATFTYGDVASRFFRRDGKFLVNTDGPDGKLADFDIRYTFGVTPLQQYLIAFPDGRMQALGIAWDSRPEDKGGQRWFHLYPGEKLKAGDPLHWTGIDQTWNFQCAECHSTELRKNYDAQKNTYATTWAEIDVACEACHGPGSVHVAWAKRQKSPLPWGKGGDNGLTIHFDERKNVSWTLEPGHGNARRSTPRTSARSWRPAGCAIPAAQNSPNRGGRGSRCCRPTCRACCSAGLFEADGKSLDEVYNYAPFRQSKMFVAGVSCSDCHDPHSLKLVAEGNAVCEQCHDGQKYAATSHHHHENGSTGARCVACHMPARTYMIVDPRHDHAFRVPRPDESVRFGTSNACNDCHTDKDAAWAAAAVERWFGPERKGFQTWTETFAAARADKVEAAALLLKLASSDAPSIARATAFESLALHPSREALTAAERGLADADPLVRLAALRTLRMLPVEQSWPLAHGLLTIRCAASGSKPPHCSRRCRRIICRRRTANRLSRAIDEYVAAQRLNADRPEYRVNLGNLYARQGRVAEEPPAARRDHDARRRTLDGAEHPRGVRFSHSIEKAGELAVVTH